MTSLSSWIALLAKYERELITTLLCFKPVWKFSRVKHSPSISFYKGLLFPFSDVSLLSWWDCFYPFQKTFLNGTKKTNLRLESFSQIDESLAIQDDQYSYYFRRQPMSLINFSLSFLNCLSYHLYFILSLFHTHTFSLSHSYSLTHTLSISYTLSLNIEICTLANTPSTRDSTH